MTARLSVRRQLVVVLLAVLILGSPAIVAAMLGAINTWAAITIKPNLCWRFSAPLISKCGDDYFLAGIALHADYTVLFLVPLVMGVRVGSLWALRPILRCKMSWT